MKKYYQENMIEGIIFDLDGTLIDSEPLWQDAEIAMFKREGLILSRADCTLTKGLQPYEAVKHWHNKISNPKKSISELTHELGERVIDLIIKQGELKPGVINILEFWKDKGRQMAIASASPMKLIEAVVDKFELQSFISVIISGDTEQYGKPHPGIFLSAAQKLKVDPVFCIAFEDSFNGMISVKAARMKLVALLDEGNFNDTKYDFADLKLESFHNFGPAEYEYLKSIL